MSDDERPDEGQVRESAAGDTSEPGGEEDEPATEAQEPDASHPREEPEARPAPEGVAEPAAADEERPTRREEEGEEAARVGDATTAAPTSAVGRADLPPGAELDPIALEPERQLDAEERARLEAEAEERARREAEATAEGSEEPLRRHEPRVQLDSERRIQATGKRKASVARVLVQAGSGEFQINGRGLDEYFPRVHLRTLARQALVASGYEDTVDVRVRVHGGGTSGQAGAISHGVARALTEVDPDLRGELKRRGLLSRDARIKERRKAGLKKARKRPQFSKR
jgi:small subunit ribosomal protein S9